jgi:hypothetical protein
VGKHGGREHVPGQVEWHPCRVIYGRLLPWLAMRHIHTDTSTSATTNAKNANVVDDAALPPMDTTELGNGVLQGGKLYRALPLGTHESYGGRGSIGNNPTAFTSAGPPPPPPILSFYIISRGCKCHT